MNLRCRHLLLSIPFIYFLIVGSHPCLAQQGIGIGTEDVHESAVLEIKSENLNKGLLIPKVPNNNAVSNPAQGLLVYNTSTHTFDYFNGSSWLTLIKSDYFDATVADLTSEINTLKSRATVLEGKVSILESKVSTLESEVNTLTNRVATLEDDMSVSPSSGERNLPSNVNLGAGYNISIPYIGSNTYNVSISVIGTMSYKERVCFGDECVWAWSSPQGFTHNGNTSVINKQKKSFRVVFDTAYVNIETGAEILHVRYVLQKFTYTARK